MAAVGSASSNPIVADAISTQTCSTSEVVDEAIMVLETLTELAPDAAASMPITDTTFGMHMSLLDDTGSIP